MAEAAIEFGSNLGNLQENIKSAIESVKKLPGTKVLAVSDLYETEPFGVPDQQQNYINCCIKIETTLLPETLLGACLGIEAAMGRIRTFRNASRIIDVDLLFYDNLTINTNDLRLPHPRIFERAFVLIPLSDLYKDKKTPSFDFAKQLELLDRSGVRKL